MLCEAVALCAFVSGWLTNAGFDAPHRDAVLTYIEKESGFNPNVIEYTGACLPQWAGDRRKTALAAGGGRCPSVTWQLERIKYELTLPGYNCFWRVRTYDDALRMLRKGFGRGHC